MEEKNNDCTLTDIELAEKANEWVDRLIKTGGRDWSLPVPANPNKDVDLILSELNIRFTKYAAENKELKEALQLALSCLTNGVYTEVQYQIMVKALNK